MGRKERLGLADPTGDRFSNGLQFVTTLFTAFLNGRESTPMFRNDEEVAGLSDVLAGETGRDDFFATVIFENSAQVLLDPEADDDTWPFWRARRRAENAPPVTDVAMRPGISPKSRSGRWAGRSRIVTPPPGGRSGRI